MEHRKRKLEEAKEWNALILRRWINGLEKLSPTITAHYQENYNQRKLVRAIPNHILPMVPDSTTAVQAHNVSPQKKAELSDVFSFKNKYDEEMFVTDMRCFAIQLRFEKRDVPSKQLLTTGQY